jgi:hypothetical protein
MAMRIGDQYHCDRVRKADFEKMAMDAGLSKPMVNRRIPELAGAILDGISRVAYTHPVIDAFKEQIRTKCENVRENW